MSRVIKRCQGCEFEKVFMAQGGFKFMGCTKEPYKGKLVGEIKNCPLGKPLK